MKVSLKQTPPKNRLPKIGETWCHSRNDPNIYLRIDSSRVNEASESYIYSVCLNYGGIKHTNINNSDFCIVEPVGGTVEFEAV